MGRYIARREIGLGPPSAGEFMTDFLRFYVLSLLYEGPRHGYEIMEQLDQRLGRAVSPSFIYPFLDQLEERGVLKHGVERVGRREKKVYKLTNAGKNFCQDLFRQFAKLVSTAIEPTLDACTHCGCRVYKGGHREAIGKRELIFCCRYCAASYKAVVARIG